MIIKNVCVLLEMFSIVFCLHYLYGRKFSLDMETVCLLAVDMLLMQIIETFGLPNTLSFCMYPVIAVYCKKKFDDGWKKIIINMGICLITIGIVQMLITYMFCYWRNEHFLSSYDCLLVSSLSFLLTIGIFAHIELRKLALFLSEKGDLLFWALGYCIVVMLIWLYGYRANKLFKVYQTLFLITSVFFVFMLIRKASEYKIKSREMEAEIKMHDIYMGAYEGLVEQIRLRQHEFNNHISAIYSQHYTCSSYEELVNAQKSYCRQIEKENRFHKMLSMKEPILIGFLYSRFLELDRQGIEVTYRLKLDRFREEMPDYKVIEILGELISNAADKLKEQGNRGLYVEVLDTGELFMEVRNEGAAIGYGELVKLFEKGYSTKGESRGLGLYNIRKLCKEYGMTVSCENRDISGTNWVVFQIKRNQPKQW